MAMVAPSGAGDEPPPPHNNKMFKWPSFSSFLTSKKENKRKSKHGSFQKFLAWFKPTKQPQVHDFMPPPVPGVQNEVTQSQNINAGGSRFRQGHDKAGISGPPPPPRVQNETQIVDGWLDNLEDDIRGMDPDTQALLRQRFHRQVSEFLALTSSTVLTRIDFHDYRMRPTIKDLDFGSSSKFWYERPPFDGSGSSSK